MRPYLLILFLFLHGPLLAQPGLTNPGLIRGEVVDALSGAPLPAVTVVNRTTGQSAYTEPDGSFSIRCLPGQMLAFSCIGYKSLELSAPEGGSYVNRRIALHRQNYELKEYIFRPKYTPYQADSIQRQSTYQRAMARQKSGSLGSPVTLLAERLSKRSRQIFRFQKDFNYWEGQRYIDSRYTPELVTLMTHMSGDSLAHFMNAYPMPYDYARVASELEIKMWIRTNFREWKARQLMRPAGDTLQMPDTAVRPH